MKELHPVTLFHAGKGHNNMRNKRTGPSCFYRHILFVIDTSGSIRQENFIRITNALGDLTTLFCPQVRIAVMTFDHEYFVEFCFNEYGNDCCGRRDAGLHISSIPYIREGQPPGTRWTHTAGAAQCVCRYMLEPALCGLDATCKDVKVVFITDGNANDPNNLDICTEILCLHNDPCVDTLTIGIGDMDELKLECMREDSLMLGSAYGIFTIGTFKKLEEELSMIKTKLTDPSNTDYHCTNFDDIIG